MKSHLRELGEIVSELSRHFAIWYELVNPEKKNERESLISDHEDFFASTALAHFIAYCTTVYLLYDHRPDVNSIPTAVRYIKAANSDLANEINHQIGTVEILIEKIRILRNKVFGHRDLAISPSLIFQAVEVTPEQMGQLVGHAQDQVGKLLEAHGADTYIEYQLEVENAASCARSDTVRIIEALKNNAL